MKKFLIFICLTLSINLMSQDCIIVGNSSINLPDNIATNACTDFGLVEVNITPSTDCIQGETGYHRVYFHSLDYEFISVASDNNTFTTSLGTSGVFNYVEIIDVIPIDPTTDLYENYTVKLKPLETWQASQSGQQIIVTVFEENQTEFNIGVYGLDVNQVDILQVIDPSDNVLSSYPAVYNPSTNIGGGNLYIEGDFVIDINSKLEGIASAHDKIYLEGGSSIIVDPNIASEFNYIDFVVCEDMTWDGFSLGDQSELTLNDNEIYDAEKAISASSSVSISLVNNAFTNNYYDLYLTGSNSDVLTIEGFKSNTFENTSTLKQRPSGLPIPSYSPTNIRISGYPNADLRSEEFSENVFRDAGIAISASNTNAIIEWNIFETSGTGIQLYGTTSASEVDNNIFTNKTTGIKVTTHGIRSESNTYNNVDFGYYLLGTGEREVEIQYNDFNVNKKAIFSFFNTGATIFKNTIDILSDNSNSIGVDLFYTNGAVLRENTLNLEGIHAGLFLNSSSGSIVQENTINLEDPSFGTRAIDLMDAANTVASCNLLEGNYPSGQNFSDGVGIFLQDAPVSIIACNLLDEIEDGIKYIGSSFDSELLGNTFGDHGTALELGDQDFNMNTIISDQEHHGNKWDGSTTIGARNNSSEQNIITQSEFFVDNLENSAFLPSIIIPNANWFFDVDDMNSTFECIGSEFECDGGPGSNFTFNIPSSEYINFIRLQLDSLNVSDNEKWIWKNQILEYIKNNVDSNDYTPEITALLNGLNNTIQDDFSNVQVEINDAFEPNTQINSLSTQILNNLALYSSTNNTTHLDNNLPLMSQLETAYLSAETSKQTHLDNADMFLSNISVPSGDDVGQDYFDAYSILIKYLENEFSLTSSQETVLQAIASKCPTEYGKAVSLARGMLRTDDETLYEDFVNCPASGPRRFISNSNEELQVNLFPNPVENRINFSQKVKNVSITDYSGKIVLNNSNEIETLDVSSLQAGIYMVTFSLNGNTQSKKFIKI